MLGENHLNFWCLNLVEFIEGCSIEETSAFIGPSCDVQVEPGDAAGSTHRGRNSSVCIGDAWFNGRGP